MAGYVSSSRNSLAYYVLTRMFFNPLNMDIKARTIIEKHGFLDPDRKNPKHDEIQLWVYRNFITVIKTVFPQVNIENIDCSRLKMEFPISDRNYIVGFADLCLPFEVAVEVKSTIPSIGDLIRQIQFYRNYMGGPTWIVVSPDDRPAEILREHGIFFYKYRSPGELPF